MFLSLQIALSTRVSYEFLTMEKVYLVIWRFWKCQNSDISKLQSLSSPSIYIIQVTILHQNVCLNVVQLIISVSQVNLYWFESRHDR